MCLHILEQNICFENIKKYFPFPRNPGLQLDYFSFLTSMTLWLWPSGDLCDDDIDGDGLANGDDNCPYVANTGQGDDNGRSYRALGKTWKSKKIPRSGKRKEILFLGREKFKLW